VAKHHAKPKRARGRVEPANLDHLRAVKFNQHGKMLKGLKAVAPPPATWDSRLKGWVGPIKDQGSCGSCWDFSGTGVCEVAGNMVGCCAGPGEFVLSEQYTLDCGKNGGCGGDDNTTVLAWAQTTGIPLTSVYGPYTGSSGLFDSCKWTAAMKLYQIGSWGFADSNGGNGVTSVADIKQAIMSFGCVGCAIAANDDFENLDPTQVYQGGGIDQMLDHDIILVGWDDTKVTAAQLAAGQTAWILRNSWGLEWGGACGWSGTTGGYCWILSGANSVGSESVWAQFPGTPTPTPIPPPSPTPGPTPAPVVTPIVIPSGNYTFSGGSFTPVTSK
jgi:C1A family cysteine protease